jgi:hypothetical protein
MKREIQISRKTISAIVLLIIFLIAIIGLIGAGFLILHNNPTLLSGIIARFEGAPLTAQADPGSAPDAQAAARALTAFYTLDYSEPVDQWQGRVCTLATTDGCRLIQTLFAPTVYQVVKANQVKTGCTVQAVSMVEDDGTTRIWKLEVTLGNPWPGEASTTPVYAEVAQANGAWLLNRILFSQETARFENPTSTP